MYEEVNKKSLKGHYIGLHNESTFKKTATYGAFVCFNPASVSGGEFFIADGAKIFRDMKTDVLERLYNQNVRISVSNLDVDFLGALGPLKEQAMDAVKNVVATTVAPKFDMDLDMVYGADGARYPSPSHHPTLHSWPISQAPHHPHSDLAQERELLLACLVRGD